MKRVIYILFFIVVVIINDNSMAQNVNFSQFYATPLYMSPSLAGSSRGSRISLNYRNQWPKLGSIINTSFSVDHNFQDWNSGVGFLLVADQAGDGRMGTINTGIIYSYDIAASNKLHIRPGLNFQYAQSSINFADLYDVTNISSGGLVNGTTSYELLQKSSFFDLSSSIIAYTKDFWGGITIDHLFRPNPALSNINQAGTRLPIKLSFYGGGKYMIDEDKKNLKEQSISAIFLYSKRSTSNLLNFGMYWNYTPIAIGILYRGYPSFKDNLGGADALVFMTGFRIDDISIGYSFDYTLSELAGIGGGAHEVSIIYLLNSIRVYKKKRWEAVPCPDYNI